MTTIHYLTLYATVGLCIFVVAAGQAPNKNIGTLLMDIVAWPVRVVGNFVGVITS